MNTLRSDRIPSLFRIMLCISVTVLIASSAFAGPPSTHWNTFLGGVSTDYGYAVDVAPDGSVYVAGLSYSSWGSPLRTYSGLGDGFVAKLSSSGVLLWCTFLGSPGEDDAVGIEVGADGCVYVLGESYGSWGTPLRAHAGSRDVYVAKLNANGTLLWNTFLGSSSEDWGGRSLAFSPNGDVCIVGHSYDSWGSPVRGYSGSSDFFVASLSTHGVLQWHTFLGGTAGETSGGIDVAPDGSIFVTGDSRGSWGLPLRPFTAGVDGFAARLDYNGVLQWNTFFGGSEFDGGLAITLDGNGKVFISGSSTGAWGTPVLSYSGDQESIVVCLNSAGVLQWNTFLGTTFYDAGWDIVVDAAGDIYTSGVSLMSWGAPLDPFIGLYDGFVAKLTGTGQLLWNTFIGSVSLDMCSGLSLDAAGNLYVTGISDHSWGAPIASHNGLTDAFVVKYCNQASASVTVSASPAPHPDLAPNTIYLGYGPQSLTMEATGGVSYSWSPTIGLSDPDAAITSVALTVPGTHMYTVTATGLFGCMSAASVVINVVDVADPSHSGKVLVCHNGNTLSIDMHAVTAHLNHGDQLGACISKATVSSRTIPERLRLEQNHPNPFNPQTTIEFGIPEVGTVRISVYNLLGRELETLTDRLYPVGMHRITFDASNYPSGLYLYRLEWNGAVLTKQMAVMK